MLKNVNIGLTVITNNFVFKSELKFIIMTMIKRVIDSISLDSFPREKNYDF